jgi:hypothetical protein
MKWNHCLSAINVCKEEEKGEWADCPISQSVIS